MAVLKYIGRRLLMLIPVLIGISLAAFLLGRIAPGDPVDDALFRIGIEFPTEADRAAMRAELGLDRPLPEQYLRWLGDALRGDLGESYTDGRDIARELMRRLPITLKVSLAAMVSAILFGVGGGVLMAACRGTWVDAVLKALSTLLLSVPGFWLALFLITVFAEWLHLLPTSGLDRGIFSLILPAVALSAANVGSTSRFTRGNILAQMGEQYIVVANAKGISQKAVMLGHAFRNSLVPIVTLIGNYFGGILGGSTIIENIFAIPGLGSYVLSAINNRDYPVIQGYVLLTGATFVLITLAIDLLYILVNPKIRVQGGEP
ncbi:MAG: ABC transporter permease [Clostridiales bacterium]|nr:ABC transporter permease [Flavonifractor sp.]MDU2196633.1 ABC transporter permease [Clostridiales bacterium]